MPDVRDPAVEALADALDRGLKRAQQAIDQAARRNAKLLERASRVTGEPWMSELAQNGSGPLFSRAVEGWKQQLHEQHRAHREAKWQRKLERRKERRLRKEHQRQEALAHAGNQTAQGVVMLVFAAAMGALAFIDHRMWWMVFPAFAFGMGGASMIGTGGNSKPEKEAQGARVPDGQPDVDSRDQRVDGVCAKIAAELKSAPASVKDLVGSGAKRIEQLRSTCRSLTQRERELRKLCSSEDDARLLSERDELSARISSESDEIVRARLQGALEQLEQQRKERGALVVAAARLEAEHTRIAYTLESLYTQILRMKSADAAAHDPAEAALRQSLGHLGEEMDALAEAMESVSRDTLSPVVSVGAEPPSAGRARERG